MMSGCGVRGLAGGTETEGISEKQKQNKNIPLTGLQRRPSHSGMALQKKAQSLPILFWAQPVVQKRSDGWLEGRCCKNAPRSQGGLLSQLTLQAAPSKKQEAFSPLLKRLSSGEAATAASPSAVPC